MKNVFDQLISRTRQSLGGDRLDQKLFYIHLAKCGGTSVEKAIRMKYQTLDPRRDRRLHSVEAVPARKAVALTDIRNFDFREIMLLYYMARPSTLCVSGHFPFSQRAFDEFSDDFKFVTLLRHPVKRWISQYFHHRFNDPSHPDKTELSPQEFVETEQARQFGATFVSSFQGPPDPDGNIDKAIAEAIKNLRQMHLVGRLEQLDQFAAEFKELFKVTLKIPHLNVSRASGKQKKDAIDKATMARIEELCAPDLAVYNAIFG